MKILVTGGAGFIGSNFIRYIFQKYPNYNVINFDAETYAGNRDNLKDIAKSPNYTFVKGDIADAQKVRQALAGVDIVVNFAAESHVDRSILDPSPFILTNVVGTHILLDAALDAKIKRFHHISTDEVFGALILDSREKFNEETPCRPNSPYAASKAASDHLVCVYHKTYRLPITISNCSNNFGPYQFPEKLISLAITNILEGKKVPIYGDGLYVRDWLYVEDHCRAIDLVLSKGKVGETYCIGDGNDIPNIEVIRKILGILKMDEGMLETVADRPGHDRRYAINPAKIKKELGWQAEYSFDEALRLTIEWYRQNEAWWKKLKGQKFKEYYQKQYADRK